MVRPEEATAPQPAGDDYVKWEGFKDEATGETKIGLSYANLCRSIKVGGIILIADGAISIEVLEILNPTELRGRVINSFKLGQRKNCNLPGVCVWCGKRRNSPDMT